MAASYDFPKMIDELKRHGVNGSVIETLRQMKEAKIPDNEIQQYMDTCKKEAQTKIKEFNKFLSDLSTYGVDKEVIDSVKYLDPSGEEVPSVMKEMLDTAIENRKEQFIKDKEAIEKTTHLFDMAEEKIPGMIYSKMSIYVYVTIGGQKIKCLLDTGAEQNIITMPIIKKCGLETFVDTSVRMPVKGVGESKIIGKIWYVDMNIDGYECPCLFDVMDAVSSFDVILGCAFMTTYRVSLDFASKSMVIGGKKFNMIISERV